MDNPFERPVRAFDAWQQRHRVPAVAVAVFRKFSDDQAGNYVALLTYYAFVSTFPLLLVFVTITEFVLHARPDLQKQLLDSVLVEFPGVGTTIQESIRTPGSGFALVVGLALAVWGANGLAGVVQTVLNALWLVPKRHWPGFPFNYLRSFAMLFVLGGGVVLTALMTTFAGAGRLFGLSGTGVHLLTILLTTVVYCGLFLLGFRLAISQQVATRDLVLGAVLSGIVWQLLQTLSGELAAHYLFRSRSVGGVFAVVLGLLTWFGLQATLTVYVVELDVVRARGLWPRSLLQPPLTAADERYLRAVTEAETRRPEQHVDVAFDADDGNDAGAGERADAGADEGDQADGSGGAARSRTGATSGPPTRAGG